MELTPAKTDVRQVFIVINEHWGNKHRVQINRFSKEPTVIGHNTVLHHGLGYPTAKGSLDQTVTLKKKATRDQIKDGRLEDLPDGLASLAHRLVSRSPVPSAVPA